MAGRIFRASSGVSRLIRTGGGMLALGFKNPAHQQIVYGIGEQIGNALEEGLGFVDGPPRKKKTKAKKSTPRGE